MPMVQHGPWVREGTSGGVLIGAAHSNELMSDGELPSTFVGFDAGVHRGWVPADSTSPAFSVGIQTSLWTALLLTNAESWQVALSAGSLDTYVSLPFSDRLATSFGGTISINHFLPYVQFGSKRPDGGWYSTQSLLLIPDEEVFVWLPSVTKFDSDRRPRGTHFTIGGGVGSRRDETLYMFMVAVYMEFFQRKRVR